MKNPLNVTDGSDFVPEDDIPMDKKNSLDQLTATFQSIRDGLPELIKNSKDQYNRLGILEKEKRLVIVLVSEDMNKIGILDFAGARYNDLLKWKVWSLRSSDDSKQSYNIEAGHGNGGKAFMVRGCTVESSICSCFEGKINKMGFKNYAENQKYLPGWFKNAKGNTLENFNCKSSEESLEMELKPFGLSLNDLFGSNDTSMDPELKDFFSRVENSFKKRKSFTFVQLNGIKEWERYSNKIRKKMMLDIGGKLCSHSQAALTIETCEVCVVCPSIDSIVGPLKVEELEPFIGLEKIPPIAIPDILIDPEDGSEVKTSENGGEKKLVIRTSKRDLRLSGELKPRNVIRIKNERNIISNWSLAELDPNPTSSFIYGELICPVLSENYLAGSDRKSLVDAPLIRALKHWVIQQVSNVATEIQKIQSKDRKGENLEAGLQTLQQFRELMKEFLHPETNSSADEGEGSGQKFGDQGKKRVGPKPPIEYGEKIDVIEVEDNSPSIRLGLGTTIPIMVKCYQKVGDKKIPIRNKELILMSENKNLLTLDEKYLLTGLQLGATTIKLKDKKTQIESNPITIDVVDISNLEVTQPDRELKKGERIQLKIKALDTNSNVIESLLYETQVDEGELGKISRTGVFTAGDTPGTATVRTKWGPKDSQFTTCLVNICDEAIKTEGTSPDTGIPLILMCGAEAPGMETYNPEQRTQNGGEAAPTIIDYEPFWDKRGIIWINQGSHESLKVRRRGHKLDGTDTKNFKEFLALKCFDVLKRLKVKEEFGANKVTSQEFLDSMARAEIGATGFLEAAYNFLDDMTNKEKNGVEK